MTTHKRWLNYVDKGGRLSWLDWCRALDVLDPLTEADLAALLEALADRP